MDDDAFLDHVATSIGDLPGVLGVALGGSRAQGVAHDGSDWDFALYYRGTFDPEHVRGLGWEGQVTELGGWGPLFNGGGALRVDGRPIDIHYRDLDVLEHIQSEAEAGRFTIEPLLFHQAGIPTYLLLAELAVNRVLRGDVPRPEYPAALRREAPPTWRGCAELTLHYARAGHAVHGRVAQCAGLVSEAACSTAHAVLAANGEWVTNEKQLLTRAGLRGVDEIVASMTTDPATLVAAVDRAEALLKAAV